ncbi:protein of unknown function DUF214 [Syntrophobotulus glycolicus DSM 8271]|uniref:Cell division protein FtsX n=1 Tax=Syntrophobotulus glycolicus (strain DSM 8271 / FlGlyR) TaxID=645991 RepID=F0T285_SYNGF|nr:permease-like cell division protein FtsX [Syntrophobotulus glycolicus]ADY57513.1 protein of unknown function DUF214 [Syntrophobotulus glycolicus DSM 8271]
MAVNSAGYIIQQALLSLKRNIWLTVASILTLTIALVLLGFSFIFLANTSNIAKNFESQVEIAVFIEDNSTPEQIEEIRGRIERLNGVATVTLITKEQALPDFQNSMGSESLVEDMGGVNPLPDKFSIVSSDAHLVKDIANSISGIQGVEKVRYGEGILEDLLKFTDWLRMIGIGVVIAFAGASLILISLNIKTNVYSREKEIRIMRLVGASNAFIRWPFFVEGVFMGFLGAVFAIIIVGVTYSGLMDYIITTLTFVPIVSDALFVFGVLGAMLLIGITLGVLGTAISMRKFLNF